MPHLMLPLTARRIGIVHEQNLREIHDGILELNAALDDADGEVEFAGGIFFSR